MIALVLMTIDPLMTSTYYNGNKHILSTDLALDKENKAFWRWQQAGKTDASGKYLSLVQAMTVNGYSTLILYVQEQVMQSRSIWTPCPNKWIFKTIRSNKTANGKLTCQNWDQESQICQGCVASEEFLVAW